MANKIFLRVGSWYRATAKYLSSDLEITELIDNVDADYPAVVDADAGGGGGTLQAAIDAGAVLTKDNTIDAGGHNLSILNSQYITVSADNNNDKGADLTAIVSGGDYILNLEAYDSVNETKLSITKTSATIQKDAGTAKEIATIRVADNFANDAAAAIGGIRVGEQYHTSGAVKVRLA